MGIWPLSKVHWAYRRKWMGRVNARKPLKWPSSHRLVRKQHPYLSQPYWYLRRQRSRWDSGLIPLFSVCFIISPTLSTYRWWDHSLYKLLSQYCHVLSFANDSSNARCRLAFQLQICPAHNCLVSLLRGRCTSTKPCPPPHPASLSHLALPDRMATDSPIS